jgi:CRP/FNR family transcriptional regulator, cyclic AMP receptor protein
MPEPVALEVDEPVAQLLNRTLRLESFFPEFTAEHARKLFPRSGFFGYPRDAVIVTQGEGGRDLFVVFSGRVAVQRVAGSQTLALATLEPGSVLGEIALLSEVPRTATVTALEETKIFRLAYLDLQYLLANNDELAAHLKTLAAKRLGL